MRSTRPRTIVRVTYACTHTAEYDVAEHEVRRHQREAARALCDACLRDNVLRICGDCKRVIERQYTIRGVCLDCTPAPREGYL